MGQRVTARTWVVVERCKAGHLLAEHQLDGSVLTSEYLWAVFADDYKRVQAFGSGSSTQEATRRAAPYRDATAEDLRKTSNREAASTAGPVR